MSTRNDFATIAQPPTRILVPTDLTEGSHAAVKYAAVLGEQLRSDVDLLHVCRPPDPRGGELPDFVKADFLWDPPPDGRDKVLAEFVHTEAGHKMMDCLEELQDTDVEAHGRLAFGDPHDPSDAILAVAAEEHYGLIVMATHGRERLLKRSIAEKIVQRAPCPVVTIRVGVA